ncbi:right-handed parallel beta-helix repeat-containing protein [Metabacillus herbersteinensis]|uniref:Right-handed parallel beta-helix repeat-containing protein n=1 Tax=Metabacillus herbersteinensis TaxID=283816 RepID=A0ABV6G982_9BACI
MNLDDLEDVDLTTSPPLSGNVLSYNSNNAKWIPENINFSSYLIELERWGIKNDGTDAFHSTLGINNALDWASTNGYGEVMLPKGTYLIDETSSITLKSFMTLNLNGAILKIQDNSLEKYQVVKFDNVIFSRITNGVIKGDRDTHIYVIDGVDSDTHEGGVGINVYRDCRFISVDNLDIYNFTGDAIIAGGTFPSLPYYLRQSSAQQGAFSLGDGSSITDSKKIRFTTKVLMNNPYIVEAGHWGIYGGGYGDLGSDIFAEFYDVIFYNSDDSFHSSIEKVQFFDEVPKPKDASYAKVVLYQNTIPTDSKNNLLVRVNRHPEKIFFEKLNVHHCRRQGMSLGGKHIYIRDNEIHHIGGDTFYTGTDPQGGIDIEDGYDLNQHFYIERNNFHDNWGYDLVITNGKYMYIAGNRFNKVAKYVSVAINAPTDKSFFINNILHQCNVTISGEVIISENHFYGTACFFGNNDNIKRYGRNIEVKDSIFHNSVLTIDQIVPYTVRIDGCKFLNDHVKLSTFSSLSSTLVLKSEPQIIMNCSFDGNDSNYTIYNLNNPKSGWLFDNLIFKNISKHFSFPPSTIRDCKFIDIATLGINSSPSIIDADVEFINCWIKNTDQNNPLITLNNIKSFKMESCFIEKKDSSFLVIQNITDQVIIRNNTFRYPNAVFSNRVLFDIKSPFTGTLIAIENNILNSSLDKQLFSNETTNNPQVLIVNNIMTKINVIRNKETFMNNFINGVLDPYYHMNTEPISGYYVIGDLIYNTNPTPGGFIGWICTTTGYANNRTWTPSTPYTKGTIIYFGDHVYQAQNSGSSNPTPPSFPTSSGQTVNDNTVTWREIGLLSLFNKFGMIQT